MSDQIQLQPGTRPWLRGGGAEPVDTFAYYDMPLLGLVRLNGAVFLFRCLLGDVDDVNLWLYAPLTEVETDGLLKADGR
jgi:hypothetical protein